MRITRPALAMVLVTALAVPTLTASTAAWTDAEWVHGAEIGTATYACGTDARFESTAAGRFLSGSLLGLDLDTVAAVEGMRLDLDSSGLDIDPATALDLGAPPPAHAYANPLSVTVLGDAVKVDLTGLGVGLPAGSAGALNQYARVSPHGTAAGASGLVSNSGGVLVTAGTPDSELPEPARITLDELLPGIADVASVDLEVGAVAASSVLDGCAELRSDLWGDGTVTGVVRDYGIAGLGLELESTLLSSLVGTVESGLISISDAVDALLGTSGLISQEIGAELQLALPGLAVAALSGSVTISDLDLPGAVADLLGATPTDGVVALDLRAGTVHVDLDALLSPGPGGLNDLAPNTEIVVNADVLAPIAQRAGALIDTWTSAVLDALTAELRDARLGVDLGTTVSLTGTPIVEVGITLDATLGAVLDGTASFGITTEVLGLVAVLDLLLSPLGLSVSGILATLGGLATGLIGPTAGVIADTALAAVTTLGGDLGDVATVVLELLDDLVAALPNVLSVMVNVQPDQPGAPPGSVVVPAGPRSTPQYTVSALRIGLTDGLAPPSVAVLLFGTASAGPVVDP